MEARQAYLLEKLASEQQLSAVEWEEFIAGRTPELAEELQARARAVRDEVYGREVYTRGLIEFTNYCKNDCLYCGIRKSNHVAQRYRLEPEDVLACCAEGWKLGFRTFVLQGGEDPYFTDERLVPLVAEIRQRYPECAITLSVGERSRESYQALFSAGANRYLLRHETADPAHYATLHPEGMSARARQQCLFILREIGYQVGSGFMVGSPGQTPAHLAADMVFLHELQPHMVGIGPFIPHHATPFAGAQGGTLELTLFMIAALRLMLPRTLLPATTALGTIAPDGREQGMQAGANVVMPNLSPVANRANYELYDGKICTGDESAQCRGCLEARMDAAGYQLVTARGDSKV